ncbi:MAG: hypothetical protein Q8Q73_08700 [Stagnimonas sp.]|nr:hypothetical protein [Stagnimonas sp.]
MIKQTGAELVSWDPPILIHGKLAGAPLQFAADNAFLLVPGAASADSVMAADQFKGLAGFGAGALAVIFLVLLAIPFLLRKGR